MSQENYWVNFWNKNEIINREGVHEKVGRTILGKPISDDDWNLVLQDLSKQLKLNNSDTLLDIAAGSGAIAVPFSKIVHSVTAIDISEKLLQCMKNYPGIEIINADIRTHHFNENQFSKVIFYFALQHFNEKETIQLFFNIHKWLKPDGICLIGDIPDEERKFNFFNTPERQKKYFESIINETPIIGNWFNKKFIQKLGEHVGFTTTELIQQPSGYINAHYRFDVKLTK